VIAAFAASLVLSTPLRPLLIERWLRASPAHALARLNSAPVVARNGGAVPADLPRLAARELSIPGRYQIGAVPAPSEFEPWWLRLWRWTYDRWQQLWHALFGRVHFGRGEVAGVGDFLLVLVALLLIGVAISLIVKLQILRSERQSKSEPLAQSPSSRALYRRACDAARGGEYGSAVLFLFAALVALLDRRGVAGVTSSATVGDLRRALRAEDAALLMRFDAVAAPFVQRAYAERSIDEPQWQRARAAFDALQEGGAT